MSTPTCFSALKAISFYSIKVGVEYLTSVSKPILYRSSYRYLYKYLKLISVPVVADTGINVALQTTHTDTGIGPNKDSTNNTNTIIGPDTGMCTISRY